jgi:hypothetical protein
MQRVRIKICLLRLVAEKYHHLHASGPIKLFPMALTLLTEVEIVR